jgi:DGQHR domain-containing protein
MDRNLARQKISKLTDPRLKEVGNLLVDIGLELIACGNNETKIKKDGKDIGQIDLVLKDEDVERYFWVEVSTQKRDSSNKINSFFSKWSDSKNIKLIKSKFSISPRYRIHKIFFELIGNKEISDSVKHNLDDQNNSILLNYDLNYFVDALGKIGKWAKNDFFSFLKIKPLNPRTLSNIDAIQYFIGDIRAYLYLDRVDRMLKYCYIFRRVKDEKGYQRILDKGRIGAIAKKIKSGNLLAFPNTILISYNDNSTLCDNPGTIEDCPKLVKIKTPDYYCACRIIDGQHRLLGFANLDIMRQESHYLPVIILEAVPQDKEMKTFIDINSTQKKIDRNLILTLEADFDWDKAINEKEYYEKQAVEVVKKLNKSSSLKEKIFIPDAMEERKNKITLNTLVSAIIGNNFIGGKLHIFQKQDNDIDTPYQKIRDIFSLIKQHLPEYSKDVNSFLLSNKGLRMLFRFIQIYERNKIKENVTCTVEELIKDLKNIFDNSFIKKLDDYYGEGGANKAASEVFSILKRRNRERYENLKSDLRAI